MADISLDFDVVVVGAGLGGCYLLHLLRKAGLRTTVLEAGKDIGGVWFWNKYPGARVDCEFPYYGFSDPAIWETFPWTERFPSGDELRAYFEHVAKIWDLHKDIQLSTRVTAATYMVETNHWQVETEGQSLSCRWLIAATGTSFKQHIPDWKDLDKFQGAIHHSALWPETGAELSGKRIAIIGAGSTALQIVQEAAKVGRGVTQFIRTPNFAVPMRQRTVTKEERFAYKPVVPHVFNAIRNTNSGLPAMSQGLKVFDDTPERRATRLEEGWERGGFNWSIGIYTDYLTDPKANRELYDFWCAKTRKRITNPAKRDLLAPLEPPYYINTKRPSFEQDYYECCDQDNVEITDASISHFTESGIITEDGRHREFDIVAICTGYDAVTGGLRTMNIRGCEGLSLDEKWTDGVRTHLGMFVNGFPNFMMVYGPQAPTSLANGPPLLEIQGEYILRVINQQRQEHIGAIQAAKDAEESWREHVLSLAERTLLVKTNSWYMGANIPGKRREFLIYLGGLPLYQQKMEQALDGWSGFQLHSHEG